MKIDLNADLGEGCASDAELLTLVSSANIACGFHAGDAQIMQACVREAIKNGVAIGAHPSFPDRENFGRSAMQLPPETVYAQTLYQIGALATIRQPAINCPFWRFLMTQFAMLMTRYIINLLMKNASMRH